MCHADTHRKIEQGSRLGLAGLNLVRTLSAPVLVYLFFRVLTSSLGIPGYGTGADLRIILMNMVYSGLIALAMSYNLTSGRFDFSVGAVMILSAIIGCTLTVQFKLGPVEMLGLLVAIGAVLGSRPASSTRPSSCLPSSFPLGVAMIYEAFAFMVNGGNGIKILTKPDLMIFNRLPYNLILLGAVLDGGRLSPQLHEVRLQRQVPPVRTEERRRSRRERAPQRDRVLCTGRSPHGLRRRRLHVAVRWCSA